MGDYSVGQEVQIKYDPANPASTVVYEASLPLMIGVGVLCIIIGGAFIFKALR